MLLRTTEKSGASFIRTDQLDGETDWKLRRAVDYTQKLSRDENMLDLRASVYGKTEVILLLRKLRFLSYFLAADKPKKDIYQFIGNFTSTSSDGAVVRSSKVGPIQRFVADSSFFFKKRSKANCGTSELRKHDMAKHRGCLWCCVWPCHLHRKGNQKCDEYKHTRDQSWHS